VARGDTDTEDPVTVPTPGLIETAGAGLPVTDHDSKDCCPEMIEPGVAEKLAIAGAWGPEPLYGVML
jgi:hypothetical protein